jgi:hypothetical protein
MQQYKISEESYKKFRKRWITIGIPVISCIAAIGIVVAIDSRAGEDGLNTLPFAIPLLVLVFSFSIYRGLKRQKRLLMSYTLTISESDVTREQFNTPTLTINFMEIKEILKSKKGGFIIKGRTRTDVIYVPYLISDAAALEEELGKFALVTTYVQETRKKALGLTLALLSLVAFFALILTDNKTIAVISGLLVIGLFGVRFFQLATNKSIPTSMKRRSWAYLLIFAFVVYMIYTKLTTP